MVNTLSKHSLRSSCLCGTLCCSPNGSVLKVNPFLLSIESSMSFFKVNCSVATFAIVFIFIHVQLCAQEVRDFTGGMPTMDPPGSHIAFRTILLRPKQAVPSTASKLFPTQERIQPGNAAPIILRQNFEASQRLEALRQFTKTNYLEQSLEQLDAAEITRLTPIGFADLRRAVFRERAGWEYPIGEGTQGLADILLPDVQEIRTYIKAIAARARVDIQQGKLNDAMDKICIGLGISKHIGETPVLICKLLQAVTASNVLGAIEELIQHPASENLYWHIGGIPAPFVVARPAIQIEKYFWLMTVTELANLDLIDSESKWDSLAQKVRLYFDSLSSEAPNKEGLFDDWTRLSRERLSRIWTDESRSIQSMCDSEVWVRYWFMRVQARNDEIMAWASLDFHHAIPRLLELTEKLEVDLADELPVKLVCKPPLKFVISVASLQQHIDMIRTIEAIRDWSAKNNSKLPKSLQELDLPAPMDCIVNKPFVYGLSLDGRSATLQGAIVEKRGFKYEIELD